MALKYSTLPVVNRNIRVGTQPDITREWCGYNPNNFNIPVFIKGIYTDLFFGEITALTQSITNPWLSRIVVTDPSANIGDGYRHIEFGRVFPKKYVPIDRAGVSLAPVSWPHLNIITETDRTLERMHIGCSYNLDNFASYFKDHGSFKTLLNGLRANLRYGLEDALSLIVKAVILADPSGVIFDDVEIARIFGAVSLSPEPQPSLPPESQEATRYNAYMKELFTKYYSKSAELWKNVQWYDVSSYSNNFHEEMRKWDIFEGVAPKKDKAKRQMQQLYTQAHNDEGAEDSEVTKAIVNLTRNDCLLSLYYSIKRTVHIITTEASSRFWLGNNTGIQIFQTKKALEAAKKEQFALDGKSPDEADSDNLNPNTSASFNHGFQVSARPENLLLFMNPEDYIELQDGISRTGPNDTRTVSLAGVGIPASNIFPMRAMKPGFYRIVDERAFKIPVYFQLNDVQAPAEELTWRFKTHFHFGVYLFQNFAGCLSLPSAHFIASPDFYDYYGLIGQEVVKKTD